MTTKFSQEDHEKFVEQLYGNFVRGGRPKHVFVYKEHAHLPPLTQEEREEIKKNRHPADCLVCEGQLSILEHPYVREI